MSFRCRSCGSCETADIIDLGSLPLANAFVHREQLDSPELRFPLRVVFCLRCSLVQITETVPAELLFSNYLYFSSFADTAVTSARQLATRLIANRKLGPGSLVVEAASNDGYLLRHYVDAGVQVLGIEPAANIAAATSANGIRTHNAFFGRKEAEWLTGEGVRADVFHANNVLAHVGDLNGFVAGIAKILKPDGIASIEVPYLRDLIEGGLFDTIYHEHLCYFSCTALESLFERNGLRICDVERIAIHGGSLRLTLMNQENTTNERVDHLLEQERADGLGTFEYYRDFNERIEQLKDVLSNKLHALKRAGAHIAAYGASAKGTTLLNTFGIGSDIIDFVADRSTVKQGLFTPGTRIEIVSPDALLERRPEYVLLLTWNFEDEILRQQEAYRRMGGKFIVPLPEVRVV